MPTWNLALTCSTTLLFFFCLSRVRRRFLGRRPPGPKGWPILGNISDIPKKNPWLTYTEWRKTYGDIIYLESLFEPPTVILNNLEDIHELLDKRSSITASRPRMVMINEVLDWEWDFVHMPHNDRWRQAMVATLPNTTERHRKIFHQYFQQKNVPGHFTVIHKAALTLLNQLLGSPDAFRSHFQQFAATLILKMTYDHDVSSGDDYYVSLADRALNGLVQFVNVGSNVVEVFPVLRHIPAWFPGADFKRKAKIYSQWATDLREIPFAATKKRILAGTLGSCFVSDALERDNEDEEVVKNAAGIAYLAGSHTTVTIIASFVLAMLHYPDVQSRARREIDQVTGGNRLPCFDDRESLPYIDAIIAELFRWVTPTPLAVAHRSQGPDIYKGYYLPSGTIFIPNVHGVFHDEDRFSNPFDFKPERFLKENVGFDPFSMGGFGFGRRICPGRYVALHSTWLAIAQILAVFTISPKKDESGEEKLSPPNFISGPIIYPAPFEVDFIVRSSKALEIIQNETLGYEELLTTNIAAGRKV